jgi:hypothetical protein
MMNDGEDSGPAARYAITISSLSLFTAILVRCSDVSVVRDLVVAQAYIALIWSNYFVVAAVCCHPLLLLIVRKNSNFDPRIKRCQDWNHLLLDLYI